MAKTKSPSLKGPTFIRKSGLRGGGLELFNAIISKGKVVPATPALKINKRKGKGEHVVILGAGVAGLTAGYELLKNTSYQVTILEATNSVGGRSLTLRPGDKFTEVVEKDGKEVKYTQTCTFRNETNNPYPPYLNAGPGRIPSGHRNVLNYCKELDVPLEVYVMESRSDRLFSNKNLKKKNFKPPFNKQNRRIANDTRGYIAEYLYRYVHLIKELKTKDQKKEFRSLLVRFGALEAEGETKAKYVGSSRSGYIKLPGVKEGILNEPIHIQELLTSAFWMYSFYQAEDFLWQTTSFQPVGGMDTMEKALAKQIREMGGQIRMNSKVTQIDPEGEGYVINYQCGEVSTEAIKADICISNIPIPLLEGKLDTTRFSKSYRDALEAVWKTPSFLQPTCKVGWQANRANWQDPKDPDAVPIYGGISFTSDPMVQMWYPSHNFHADLGVLTGAYNYTANAVTWGKLAPKERLVQARKNAAHLHGKEFAAELKHGITIAWQNIPTQKGGWSSWREVGDDEGKSAYNKLLYGDRNFFVTGDQVSHVIGWKEGAIASALNVLAQVGEAPGYKVPQFDKAPDTAALIHPRFEL